ncbi:MAG TPA: ABC transporter substrate-binding protein [Candidatus Baltobacteraceae bacterium]|jgi:NitT/TauT family transport system substrate-binding protein
MHQRFLVLLAFALLGSTALFAVNAGARADAPQPINISYQPTNYWALPFYLATQKGWWEKVGLKPSFSTFPAGAPQVAAAAAGSWDVGSTGSVPAVLGAARYDILTIGISNDESATNALMVTDAKSGQYSKTPKDVKGQQILLTANSTGEYAVVACLHKYGMSESDVTPVNMGQAQILSALTSGSANLGALWAPNIYTFEEKLHGKLFCSGKDANTVIPGALIARSAYAKEHPDMVAKFLAVYEHSIRWERAHPAEAQQALIAADKEGGTEITAASAKAEMDLRPIYDLSQQLRAMHRSGGQSDADKWFDGIITFMKDKGSIQAAPDTRSFITDQYMQMVQNDPKLRAFANSSD